MLKDKSNDITISQLIAVAVLEADNTPVAVDLDGFDIATIAIHVGAGGITFTGTNKIEFTLTHSDDNLTYTAVTASDVEGVSSVTSGIIKSLVAAHAAATVSKFGYIGGKQYLKLLANFSGTHGTGTAMSAVVVKDGAHKKPV